MPRRILRWIKSHLDSRRLGRFFDPTADPWVSMPFEVGPCSFGLASVHDFEVYLQGESSVQVRSVDDLCHWLRGCEAVDDRTLFQCDDHWQHPVAFERLRRGDCEDHALWTWRKLRELGHPTCFVAGTWGGIAHAWTMYHHREVTYLVETTAKKHPLIQPVNAVRHQYCPALAIDEGLRTHVFQGYPRFLALATPERRPSTP